MLWQVKSHDIQIISVHKGHLSLTHYLWLLPSGHSESTQAAWPEKPKILPIWPSPKKFGQPLPQSSANTCLHRQGKWNSSHPGHEIPGWSGPFYRPHPQGQWESAPPPVSLHHILLRWLLLECSRPLLIFRAKIQRLGTPKAWQPAFQEGGAMQHPSSLGRNRERVKWTLVFQNMSSEVLQPQSLHTKMKINMCISTSMRRIRNSGRLCPYVIYSGTLATGLSRSWLPVPVCVLMQKRTKKKKKWPTT